MSTDQHTRGRWAAELQRAADRGLLTTQQAASRMNVPAHIVRRWQLLGLIHDYGGGGKGYPSLFDPQELMTAPTRRLNLRARGGCNVLECSEPHWAKGQCSRHYNAARHAAGLKPSGPPSSPSTNAEGTLRRGGAVSPPWKSDYRILARTCPSCGALMTTPDHLIRKNSGRLPRCHQCHLQTVRQNIKRREASALESARNYGNVWTGPEMELVLRGDLSVQQLALTLGRSRHGVRYIQRKLREEQDPRYVNVAGMTDQMTR